MEAHHQGNGQAALQEAVPQQVQVSKEGEENNQAFQESRG
jgi:hypothetical protein